MQDVLGIFLTALPGLLSFLCSPTQAKPTQVQTFAPAQFFQVEDLPPAKSFQVAEKPPQKTKRLGKLGCLADRCAEREPTMVALAVEELGRLRPVCFAHNTLLLADIAVERGETHLAGVHLYRAVKFYLEALCVVYGVKPAKSPKRIVRQLREAGGVDEGIGDWLRDIVNTGGKCVRCQYVRPSMVETCISLLGLVIVHTLEVDFPMRDGGVL